jgi:hypothetical protein
MKRSVLFVLVALVAGLLLALSPAASADSVIHRVSVGSADIVPPPGTDANFSLSAIQRADAATAQSQGYARPDEESRLGDARLMTRSRPTL